MKARIKATGEIVEVVIIQRKTHTGEQVYKTDDSRLIEESGLDFNVDDTPDTGLALSISTQVWRCKPTLLHHI